MVQLIGVLSLIRACKSAMCSNAWRAVQPFLLIEAAETPAAVPEDHSIGCRRVAAFARKLWAIVLPATRRLPYRSLVKARNGMQNGSVSWPLKTYRGNSQVV